MGSVSSTSFGRETWIGDRYLGYLRDGEFLAPGRWHSAAGPWEFVLRQPEHLNALKGASEFEILDAYWGDRAALVLDSRLTWVPAEWTQAEGHDHCAICWADICAAENREHFEASSGARVCSACFGDYVRSRSLGFITVAAPQADPADPTSDER